MIGILRRSFVCLILVVACVWPSSASVPQEQEKVCQPLNYDKPELLNLRKNGFQIEDESRWEEFINGLIGCLENPDPVLRDKIAYEGFTTLLRGKKLQPDVVASLANILVAGLQEPEDTGGFRQPFFALVLAEVARADRLDMVLDVDTRDALVAQATTYLRSIRDYRGFDSEAGWRHGVAHAADLLMQLSLNDVLTRDQLLDMREAIREQVAPAGTHFYIYREGERLARPILFMAARGVITKSEWADWFAALADAGPLGSWGAAFASQEGLAKLHNTKAFVQAVYINASLSKREEVKALEAPALAALKALP